MATDVTALTRKPETCLLIERALKLSEDLQLLVNGTSVIIRNERDPLALMYWNIAFEHHQGIFVLLKGRYEAPAFALLRIFQEAVLRAFVVMFGTEGQVQAIKRGVYRLEPQEVAKLIDCKLESAERMIQSRIKQTFDGLHGFTHSGIQQLTRQFRSGDSGTDIISNYSDKDVSALVNETIVPIMLLSAFMTEYLGFAEANAQAIKLSGEFIDEQP